MGLIEQMQDRVRLSQRVRALLGKYPAKLSPDQVWDIRLLLSSGVPKAGIARRFDVSFMTIRKIETRDSWGWLT
jgi:hypothetical protein